MYKSSFYNFSFSNKITTVKKFYQISAQDMDLKGTVLRIQVLRSTPASCQAIVPGSWPLLCPYPQHLYITLVNF